MLEEKQEGGRILPPPPGKIGLRSLKGKFCIISIGENTFPVEYSDIYHVLSNLLP